MPRINRYRVLTLRPWRVAWVACSWVLGLSTFALLQLLHLTCRVHVEGVAHPEARGGVIHAFWHDAWFLWLVAFPRAERNRAWLIHPAAYMAPIRIALRLMGVRLVMAVKGEDGRRATAALAELLKQGWTTAIAPDGPHGPVKTLKRGVLHLAVQSGVPIVPVRCDARPAFRLRAWDRKVVPLPFARIRIRFGTPLTVDADGFSEAERALTVSLTNAAN
jgi:lysophospholipid acyltransferase (LPLAT)-like uncharacterized protein